MAVIGAGKTANKGNPVVIRGRILAEHIGLPLYERIRIRLPAIADNGGIIVSLGTWPGKTKRGLHVVEGGDTATVVVECQGNIIRIRADRKSDAWVAGNTVSLIRQRAPWIVNRCATTLVDRAGSVVVDTEKALIKGGGHGVEALELGQGDLGRLLVEVDGHEDIVAEVVELEGFRVPWGLQVIEYLVRPRADQHRCHPLAVDLHPADQGPAVDGDHRQGGWGSTRCPGIERINDDLARPAGQQIVAHGKVAHVPAPGIKPVFLVEAEVGNRNLTGAKGISGHRGNQLGEVFLGAVILLEGLVDRGKPLPGLDQAVVVGGRVEAEDDKGHDDRKYRHDAQKFKEAESPVASCGE